MITTATFVEYTCDGCGHRCWFSSFETPKGWATLKDDHSDSYCPGCNPYILQLNDPDPDKLEKCQAVQQRSNP